MSVRQHLVQPNVTGNTMLPPSEFDYELIAVQFDIDASGDVMPILVVGYAGVTTIGSFPGPLCQNGEIITYTYAQNIAFVKQASGGSDRTQATSPIPDRLVITPQMRVWIALLGNIGSTAMSPVSVLIRQFGP